ncbi:ankyrin repeat domain-containing protein [Methylobacter sp. BlB1]|uniref:ankyrin repeat domain-containing protein n=1 Tax=Methylobacter sp. BlB1 TaxID=2785914 RepID=UPI001894F0B5|nr:ankyrin repeat domain-containing protein [Methylobacter sp. BlB1]MBF6650425.1 ankyrin repeat domain-containing protein [Methylobacter sp. BlB1]
MISRLEIFALKITLLNKELFLAASQLKFRKVKKLILDYADVNCKYESNTTPLLVAITDKDKQKSLKTVQVLIENGAEVNLDGKETLGIGYNTSVYDDTYSPLMLAARCGNYDVVKFLLEKGADVNYQNPKGDNALIYASEKTILQPGETMDEAAKEILALLISHIADINHQGRYGKTALHYACESRELFPAQILTGNGADPTIQDKDGRTPLCLAKKNKRKKIEDLLNGCIEKNDLTSLVTVTEDKTESVLM